MNHSLRHFLPILALVTASVEAAIVTEPTRVYPGPLIVPDLQDPPLVLSEIIADSAILWLTSVEVGLHLVGIEEGAGFAAEMFVALNKDLGATSILLNQVGLSASESTGAAYDGWNVTFRDDASNGDIHQTMLPAGILGGAWQPDGRTDPYGVLRSQMLSVFTGAPGNGDWRLAVGDLQLGGQMRLASWSLTLTGETASSPVIPEGGSSSTSWIVTILVAASAVRARGARLGR